MWELTEIVAPKVMAEWESLAYRMRYSPEEVKAFKRDSQDVKECCKKLFDNWLTTAHGPKPKTYLTLLNCIKKIDELTSTSEVIEKELIKGKDGGVTVTLMYYYNSSYKFLCTVHVKSFLVYLILCFSQMTKIHEIFSIK